jgi:hypothetical protein
MAIRPNPHVPKGAPVVDINLDDYVAENPPPKGGLKCVICRDLPPEIRETLAANKGRYPASTFTGWLNSRGHDIKKSTVERHMREHIR